jgi:glucose/arabinose dehydrogenase
MDPDGSHQTISAYGMRNAVDVRYVPDLDGGALFATNMGDDHLGTDEPEDTFFELASKQKAGPIALDIPCRTRNGSIAQGCVPAEPPNYGWPTCYFAQGKPVLDHTPLPEMPTPGDLHTESERPKEAGVASHSRPPEDTDSVYGTQSGMAKQGTLLAASGGKTNIVDPNAKLGTVPSPLNSCMNVPPAYTTFAAHSSPLGLAFFGAGNPALHDTFLVTLHGASHPRIGTGYRVVQFTPADRSPRPFITGFLTTVDGKPVVHGRPCGILRLAPDTFLLTDDYLGLVYYVHPKGK